MKKFLLLIFIATTFRCLGQLPKYSSNIIDSSTIITEIEQKFHDEFHVIISFSVHSFWNERDEFKILGYDGENWKIINWSYKSINSNNPKIRGERKKIFDISDDKVSELMTFLQQHDFFEFDLDSLNWNQKNLGDGTIESLMISDGGTHRFEIISSFGRRSYNVKSPNSLQDYIFIQQRKNFIDCRNKFLELFKS